jgi:hypothetical protein
MENLILFWRKIEEFCGFDDGQQQSDYNKLTIMENKNRKLEEKLSVCSEHIAEIHSELNREISKNIILNNTIEELKRKTELLQMKMEQRLYEYMKLEYDHENNRHFE